MNSSYKIISVSFSCGTARQYRINTLTKIPYFNEIFIDIMENRALGNFPSFYLPMLHSTFSKVLDYAETRNAEHINTDSEYITLMELLVIFHFLTKSEAMDRIATYMTGGCVGSSEARLPNRRHSSESNKSSRRNSSSSSSKSRKDVNLSDLYVPRWDSIDASFLHQTTIDVNVRGFLMKVPYKFLQEKCPKYFANLYNPNDNQSISEDRCIRIRSDIERYNFIDMEPKHLGHLVEHLLFPGLSQFPNNFDIYCQNVIGFNPQIPPKNNLLNQRLKLF